LRLFYRGEMSAFWKIRPVLNIKTSFYEFSGREWFLVSEMWVLISVEVFRVQWKIRLKKQELKRK